MNITADFNRWLETQQTIADENNLITSVRSAIKENSKAIVFWDTCGLMDLVNLLISDIKKPDKDTSLTAYYSSYFLLEEQIQSHQVLSFASSISLYELGQNIEDLLREFKNEGKNLKLKMELWSKMAQQFNIIDDAYNFTSLEHSRGILIERIISQIIKKTLFVSFSGAKDKGIERVLKQEAPAQKARSWTDATIWESFLTVANIALETGTQPNLTCHFISNNYKDFGKGGSYVYNLLSDQQKRQWEQNYINFNSNFLGLGNILRGS